MPLYQIEWRLPVPDEDDRVIRTWGRGSTPERAVHGALASAVGVQPYEVEGWSEPLVRDEDGELVEVT